MHVTLRGLGLVVLLLHASAGAAPADPKDLYQAWYIGVWVIASSIVIVLLGRVTAARSAVTPATPT